VHEGAVVGEPSHVLVHRLSREDRAVGADQGGRVRDPGRRLGVEAREVLGTERHVHGAGEAPVRRRAPAAHGERRRAGRPARERCAHVGAAVALALGDEELALRNVGVGIPELAAGQDLSGRVGDPNRDRLLEGRLQRAEEVVGLGSRDLVGREAADVVVNAVQQEVDGVEHLARVLVQHGGRADEGLLRLAHHFAAVPQGGGDEDDRRHEDRGGDQEAVKAERRWQGAASGLSVRRRV